MNLIRATLLIALGSTAGAYQRAGRAPHAAPPPRAGARTNAFERWNRMSPQERERELKKLPPDRQEQVRKRLDEFSEHFSSLPKEEQQRLKERYERFSHLPPEKQEQVRRDIRRYRQLPDDRRHAVAQEFESLRGMSEDQRHARLASDDFRAKYSPEERAMITNLSETLPGGTDVPSTAKK